MKLCPTCKNKYSDDANFCPREECAGPGGPQRLVLEEPPARFVPISRIGGGPSGEVWQASDAQSGAAVAYKIVAAESLPTVTGLERAQRELRQLQRSTNAHIVKVIDFGKTAEGRLFVASELASGEPLDQVVARTGPFPLDRAKRLAAQIGEALLDAQKVGVVHRDLAAKNVLVSADDEVRIINFAIPRPLTENVFGVAEYMSPEQSEGKLIDQRSNTYSLGALLYLMLTGHPPHAGESPRELIEAIQKGEITPPSIKLGGAAGGLTTEVDRILLKALERNSSRRPLTMRQFLTDVSGLIVTEQPTTAAPASGGRDAAFARTMMFAGGASEVQKLVAQAVAARQAAGSNGNSDAPVAPEAPRAASTVAPPPSAAGPRPSTATPPPSGGARPPAGTPAPVGPPEFVGDVPAAATSLPAHRPSHGAAVAATMMAMPIAQASAPPGSGAATPAATHGPSNGADSGPMGRNQLTPPPRTSAATPPPAAAGASGATVPDANFRETLWFKKGDVDQMVADARAKVAAMATAHAAKREAEPPPEDAKPLEDRYLDDGTVTTDDRKKFSLRSGGTSTSLPVRAGSIPGERMTEEEMIDEIGGGKRLIIIGIVAAVVVALIAVVAVSFKSKGKEKAMPSAAAVAVPPAPAPEPPPPLPPAIPPPEAAPAAAVAPPLAPTAKPVKPAAAEAKVESSTRPASRKHSAARKKPAPVTKKRR